MQSEIQHIYIRDAVKLRPEPVQTSARKLGRAGSVDHGTNGRATIVAEMCGSRVGFVPKLRDRAAAIFGQPMAARPSAL